MVDTLKQLFEALGFELRQYYHDPLTGAQADVCLGKGGLVTGKEDTAVLHPYIFHIHPAQLIAGNALKAK